MKSMRLSTRLFVAFILIGITPAVVLAAAVYFLSVNVQEHMSDESLNSNKDGVSLLIGKEELRLEALAKLMLAVPGTQAAISDGDATFLNRLTASVGSRDFLVFQDVSGQALSYGFGSDIQNLAYEQQVFNPAKWPVGMIKPLDIFPGRVATGGRYEIKNDSGSSVGNVFIGSFAFGDSFVDEVKKTFGVECTIFLGDERVATTIINNGKRAVGTKMTNQAVIANVMKNKLVFNNRNYILDQLYKTQYWPIIDHAGNSVGMYFIGMPMKLEQQAEREMMWIVLAILLFACLAIVVLSKMIISSITGTLFNIIDGLTTNSEQVSESADSIREASHEIAEGANTQAAAIEQTSSAVEEIASMTRRTADNAQQTKSTSANTNANIRDGSELVSSMTGAMNEINSSADQISDIIKTIQNIAFQTNLLALNAAVEAARAGEAGKGFAVVADEVRNLAGRSAQSARDTSELITTTVERVKNGAALAEALNEKFTEIETGSEQVSHLIEEIATAAMEQAQGVDQVNTAIAQMDKVTQRNATESDSTARAASNLSDAAGVLSDMVDKLLGMVEGTDKASGRSKKRKSRKAKASPSATGRNKMLTMQVDTFE